MYVLEDDGPIHLWAYRLVPRGTVTGAPAAMGLPGRRWAGSGG